MWFAATVFLGSFLLFLVQPLMGKVVLPWFGGTAAVWTTCLLFFQVMLLAGYAWAHALQRLAPAWQARLQVGLLAVSVFLPHVLVSSDLAPAGDAEPLGALLRVLLVGVGLPYFLLATTSPLLQAWYARLRPGVDPYRLFALSNLASLAALLAYPLLVEPYASVRDQAWVWSLLYGAFVLGMAWLARAQTGVAPGTERADAADSPPAWRYALWMALAAGPSVLLLAVTTRLTGDIAPMPLLWVVPLALYLLSFVLVFDRPRWYLRALWWPLLAGGLAWSTDLLIAADHAVLLSHTGPVLLATLFVACVVGHGELARSRPAPAHLTGFYLTLAGGGALGGLLVAVIAPLVFDAQHELPLALVGVPLCAVLAWWLEDESLLRRGWWALATPALLAGIVALALELHRGLMLPGPEVRLWARNFYGTLEVSESQVGTRRFRTLSHGGIEHGSQGLDPEYRYTPTTYYGHGSGVGRLLVEARDGAPQRVGLVGLGAGTLAAYARAGDVYRFYEINPLVTEIAYREFTFLSDSAGQIEIVPGDARLSLEREAPQGYDLLVVDAFNGDAVPAHLLTAEAFAVYRRHLKPDGVLAVHTSNRYLVLEPLVERAAASVGWVAHYLETDEDPVRGLNWTSWVFATPAFNERIPLVLWLATERIADDHGIPGWTDDHASLWTVLVLPGEELATDDAADE